MKTLTALLIAVSISLPMAAQSKPAGAGHWEGTLQLPDRDAKLLIDLAQNEKSEWIGTISAPELNIKDLPVAKISVKDKKVAFEIPGPPGDPAFAFDLSADGKELKGELSQGGGTFPANAKWVGEPQVKMPDKSTPIGKEFTGTWQGTIETPDGNKLRCEIKLANGTDGIAAGTLNSLDQGSGELPLTTIKQKDTKLFFELKMIGGTFDGEMKNGEIVGQWNQGMASMPLTLKRVAAADKK